MREAGWFGNHSKDVCNILYIPAKRTASCLCSVITSRKQARIPWTVNIHKNSKFVRHFISLFKLCLPEISCTVPVWTGSKCFVVYHYYYSLQSTPGIIFPIDCVIIRIF